MGAILMRTGRAVASQWIGVLALFLVLSGGVAFGSSRAAPSAVPSTTFNGAGLPKMRTGNSCGMEFGSFNVDPPVYNIASYGRDPNGFVHLRGNVVLCNLLGEARIFNLPAGFRPQHREMPTSHIVIMPNGELTVIGVNSNDYALHLDGITFLCGPAGTNGCP
jgi:hypothetical protein